MKKTLLSIAATFAFVAALQAQTEQGSILAGGSLSFDFENNKAKTGSTTVDEGNTFYAAFNPQVGYFFIDGLAAGLEVELSSTRFTPDQGDNESTFTIFSVGPFLKYYHSSGFFGTGKVAFGSSKSEFVAGNGNFQEDKDNIFGWRLGAGYALFLNDKVSLEPMLSYGSYSVKDKDADPEVKDVDSSLRISVGFQIFL